ncbi:aa3-type cytochrome c oxidase subunit IV [Notoacmeibacter ruber]|uniref:Aa3-type cytochrome c oxidase subunit IV n=1 Tax=Notoacmeibacter ruber TaxID=2670375 RepID=A0A3L7JJ35_9HYPH|nr:aa3-type cytochrome c oxidase subunit IV [Notoacmeibacter ruber]RLQ88492.1 aa3-type cytochrome c oxidase subunit IV [Notoacmeibacter ruber]
MAEHLDEAKFETGAEMDYGEHEKTYSMFLSVTKWSALFCVALLIAMAFGFFTTAGFISSTILFILLLVVSAFLIK